jgi:hypothetical protein
MLCQQRRLACVCARVWCVCGWRCVRVLDTRTWNFGDGRCVRESKAARCQERKGLIEIAANVSIFSPWPAALGSCRRGWHRHSGRHTPALETAPETAFDVSAAMAAGKPMVFPCNGGDGGTQNTDVQSVAAVAAGKTTAGKTTACRNEQVELANIMHCLHGAKYTKDTERWQAFDAKRSGHRTLLYACLRLRIVLCLVIKQCDLYNTRLDAFDGGRPCDAFVLRIP